MVDEKRKKRIGELIQHELARALLRHVEQPLFAKITIISVEVSADLSIAKVFFTVIDDALIPQAEEVLSQASGFLRKTLAQSLNLRLTPRLRFIHDKSIADGQRLAKLIDDAVAADAERHKE